MLGGSKERTDVADTVMLGQTMWEGLHITGTFESYGCWFSSQFLRKE